MHYFTILFDFDGTLADTAPVVIDIANALAAEFGYAPVTPEEIPTLKKMTARELLTQRAGISLWNIPKIRRLERRVREELARRVSDIKLFGGIPELLQRLRAQGHELGIVTSNAQNVVVDVLQRAGVEVDFIHAGSRFFGKASALKAAISEYDLDRVQTVYAGDELRDVAACKKAGIACIGVGWGFNAPEALRASGATVASTPQELLAMLTQ